MARIFQSPSRRATFGWPMALSYCQYKDTFRSIGLPWKMGKMLAPSIVRSAGTVIPAIAHNVGRTSVPLTGSSDTWPGRARPGQRMMPGTRMPPSYR